MTPSVHSDLKYLSETLKQLGASRVFLIAGPGFFKSGSRNQVVLSELSHFKVVPFDEFAPNPNIVSSFEGAKLFEQNGCDCIVAVGGGSCIDVAKTIRALLANRELAYQILRSDFDLKTIKFRPGVRMVAIPTTCGSGSEATPFATYWNNGQKYSLDHPTLVPDACFLDPNLLLTLPAYQIAATGYDCLCQAIESYWNTAATEESQALSKEAIALAYGSIKSATHQADPGGLANLQYAAYLAGRAIAITRTTTVHALSYGVTHCLGLCHGHALATLLPAMINFNQAVTEDQCNHPEGPTAVRKSIADLCKLFDSPDPVAWSQTIAILASDIGLDTPEIDEDVMLRLLDFGIDLNRASRNPRIMTDDNRRKLLSQIYRITDRSRTRHVSPIVKI